MGLPAPSVVRWKFSQSLSAEDNLKTLQLATDSVDAVLQRFGELGLTSGVRKTSIAVSAGVPLKLAHGLGAKPRGWFVTRVVASANSKIAQFTVTGTSIAAGAKFTLTQQRADAALYSLSGGNSIVLAQPGIYRVSCVLMMKSADVGTGALILVQIGGTGVDSGCGIAGRRFSTAPGDGILLSGSTQQRYASAGGTIELSNSAGFAETVDTTNATARLDIERLDDYPGAPIAELTTQPSDSTFLYLVPNISGVIDLVVF